MRKVNKRSRWLRHHNSGAKSIGYFSRLKNLIGGFFSSSKQNNFYVNHAEDRYDGYSLPQSRPPKRNSLTLNNLKKYFTHAGLIAVTGFTILSNNCLGPYCGNYDGLSNLAMANQGASAGEELIEIDVAGGENANQIINNEEKDNIASYVAGYTAPDAKKDMINRTIQEKQSNTEHDIAIIQDSYLDKVNSPVTNISDTPRKNVVMHIVKADETLWSIADKYQLNTNSIKWANGMDNSGIVIEGQELYIVPVNGVYYTVQDGDTISSIAEEYKSDIDEIYEWNDLDDGISIGEKIILPGGEVPPPPAPVVSNTPTSNNYSYTPATNYIETAPAGAGGTGQFGWPTAGMTITQYFGSTSFNPWHTGIDIDSRSGWDIFASDGGTVTTAAWGWGGGYGNHVIIDHGNGYQTLYGHLSALDVSAGQYVSKGQRIGTMGSTGWSTGPHLHFEVRYGGSYLNPLNYL